MVAVELGPRCAQGGPIVRPHGAPWGTQLAFILSTSVCGLQNTVPINHPVLSSRQNMYFQNSVLEGHQLRWPLYSGQRNPLSLHYCVGAVHEWVS